MTDSEAIDRAIDLAIVGTDADKNVINRQLIELQSLYENAINKFAEYISRDPNQRQLLMAQGSLPILNDGTTGYQYAVFPADALTESHQYSSFRDVNGVPLVWIREKYDFVRPQAPAFSYYWPEFHSATELRLWLRAAGSSVPDFFSVQGPLSIDYCFIPATAASIPAECENDFIAIFASLIKTGIEKHTLIP